MRFSDALASSEQRTGIPCSVAVAMSAMDAEDQAALNAAMVNPDIFGSTIGRALRKLGHNVPDNTVTRHRRGDCQCD